MPHMILLVHYVRHMTSWVQTSLPHLVPRGITSFIFHLTDHSVGITSFISRIIPKIIGRLSLRTWVPEYWEMYTRRSGTSSQYVQFRLTGHSPALLGSIHKRPYPLLSQGAALQNTRFGGNGIFCNTTTWLLETKPGSCKPRFCLFLFWLGRWIATGWS